MSTRRRQRQSPCVCSPAISFWRGPTGGITSASLQTPRRHARFLSRGSVFEPLSFLPRPSLPSLAARAAPCPICRRCPWIRAERLLGEAGKSNYFRVAVIRPKILVSVALVKRSTKTELIRIASAAGDTGHGVAKGAPAASLGDRNRRPGCVTYSAFA